MIHESGDPVDPRQGTLTYKKLVTTFNSSKQSSLVIFSVWRWPIPDKVANPGPGTKVANPGLEVANPGSEDLTKLFNR